MNKALLIKTGKAGLRKKCLPLKAPTLLKFIGLIILIHQRVKTHGEKKMILISKLIQSFGYEHETYIFL